MKHIVRSLPLGLFTLAAFSVGSACAPGAECQQSFDCGVGSQCTADGRCEYRPGAGGGGGGGGALNDVRDAEALVEPTVEFSGSTFEGNIGPTASSGPVSGLVERGSDVSKVWLLLPERDSTFLFFSITDPERLSTPGSFVMGTPDDTGWSDDYVQACNYDEAEYDEVLPPVTVVVSEPDDAGNVVIDIDIGGSVNTAGQARIPWVAPPTAG